MCIPDPNSLSSVYPVETLEKIQIKERPSETLNDGLDIVIPVAIEKELDPGVNRLGERGESLVEYSTGQYQ